MSKQIHCTYVHALSALLSENNSYWHPILSGVYSWEIIAPVVKGLRKDLNQPETGKWFEYLYNEMKKREKKPQQPAA